MIRWLADLTWTCHVCQDERPDARIAVAKGTAHVGPGRRIEVGVTVRYCTDRVSCSVGTQQLADRYVAKLEARR